MTHNVLDYVEDCVDFDSVVKTLQNLYIKTPNEIFARHLLANRRQQSGESLDEFLQQLRKLSKDCNLKDVTADQYREELVRDSFINGLSLPPIRQRLLESTTLSLEQADTQAISLDLAQKNADAYVNPLLMLLLSLTFQLPTTKHKHILKNCCASQEELLFLWWSSPQ